MSVSDQAAPVWARVPVSLTAAVPAGTRPETLAGLLAEAATALERAAAGEVYQGRAEVLLPPPHARSDLTGPARRWGVGRWTAATVLLWCWAERRWDAREEASAVLDDFHRVTAAALARAWPDAPAWSPMPLPADPVLLEAAARTGVLVRTPRPAGSVGDPPW